MDNTLNTLLREPKTLSIGGHNYTLRPFGVLAVPVMSRLVGDLWDELMRRPELLANRDALIGWLLSRLPGMIETKIEDLLLLLSMQTGETRDALVALPLDDFLELARACLEEGQDFFTRRVLPKLPAEMAAHGIGRTSSPPSSPPATAETTSPTTASPRPAST